MINNRLIAQADLYLEPIMGLFYLYFNFFCTKLKKLSLSAFVEIS